MSWRRYRLIVWKEVLQFRRDPLLLRLVFLMPILQLLMFGYVVGADVTNVPMAVVDHDHSASSRALVSAFENSTYFKTVATPSKESALRPLLDGSTAQVGLVIPRGTADAIRNGRTVNVGIVVDGADSRTASVASSYASQIIAQFNLRQLSGTAAAMAGAAPLDARVRVVFNPSIRAVNAMIPGLVAMILLLSVVSIMSQAVVRERARGTLEQMLITPMKKTEYLAGKITPYVGVAIIQMFFIALVGRFWFRVPFHGRLTTVALGLFLFMFTSIGLGLLISLVSRTQHQAQQMVMFILIPTMVLSGFIFPIESMPPSIVPITYFIPLRYALTVLRSSSMKGAGVVALWPSLAAMAVFSAVLFGVALASFRKTLSD